MYLGRIYKVRNQYISTEGLKTFLMAVGSGVDVTYGFMITPGFQTCHLIIEKSLNSSLHLSVQFS